MSDSGDLRLAGVLILAGPHDLQMNATVTCAWRRVGRDVSRVGDL